MSKKQIFGLAGSIILIIGVFTPIVSLPFVGSMNYFMNGRGDGTIVLGIAVISLILVFLKKYKILWLPGFASLGIMLFTFIRLQTGMTRIRSDMQTQLKGNPFAELGEIALQSIQIQWGWIVLIIGACFLIASATVKDQGETHNQD